MLKSFFLSERKLLNAILRQSKYVRASMTESCLDFKTQKKRRKKMLCLVQLSKWRECKATDAEKLLSERKLLNAILRVTQVHERCFFLMKWNVICNAEDRFSCLELFLRAKNTNAVRAKNTMLCLVQLSKWRECKAKDAEKLLSQWEKGAKCNFKSKAQVHERCFFSWNEMLFAMQKTDFHVLELFCRASHVRASMHRITSLELLRTLSCV